MSRALICNAVSQHSNARVARYTSVREKIVDPQYSGWFLHFKKGGSFPNHTWHMDPCTTEPGNPTKPKCSMLYHDKEQTPVDRGDIVIPVYNKTTGWTIYNNTNDVSGCNPSNPSPRIVVAPRQPNWQGCQAAADAMKFPIFTFWQNPGAKPGANGTCWLSNNWTKVNPQGSQVRGEEWSGGGRR